MIGCLSVSGDNYKMPSLAQCRHQDPHQSLPAACILISWSTQPGQTVLDGEPGRHSPYVAALMNAMEEGLALPALLSAIMEDVQLRTQGNQSTCVDDMGSLLKKGGAGSNFYFFRG